MARSWKSMYRIPERGVIAGVCAGVAEYFDWNVKLLRALLVVIFIFSGVFPILVIYAALWYAMDPAPAGYAGPTDSASPPSGGPSRPPTMSEVRARFERLDARLRGIEECVTDREFELRRELKKLES